MLSNLNNQLKLEVKSKYDAEFRRFGLDRNCVSKFEEFYQLIERLHALNGIQFNICYTDKDGDLLPINNDNNLARVLNVTVGILRLIIQRKGECYPSNFDHTNASNTMNNYNTSYMNSNSSHLNGGSGHSYLSNTSYRASNLITQIKNLKDLSSTLTSHHHSSNTKPFFISYPEDFRPVSAIIDVDILPDTYRRVRLHKHKSSKPLGFYIRDGRSLRVTPHGVEQVPGIFISRLMPGGLAESTGLLSVNDEVIEVNGIEVAGKTLDQVTDMMVANSSNLIITVKPTNQRYNLNRSTNNPTHLMPSSKLNLNNKQQTVSSNKTPPLSSSSSITNNNSNSSKNMRHSFNTKLLSKNSLSSSSSTTTGPDSSGQLLSNKQNKMIKQNNVIESGQITLELNNPNESLSSRTSIKKQMGGRNVLNESANLDEDDDDNDDDEDDDEHILHESATNSATGVNSKTHSAAHASSSSSGAASNQNSPNRLATINVLNTSSGNEDQDSDEKILTL